MSKWQRTFGQARNNIVRRMTDVQRRIALDAFGRVVRRTPVDTGRARGSWGVAIGQPRPGPRDREDKDGSQAMAEVQNAIATMQLGDRIFLVTSLEYMPVLETGSSGQAPAGMVRITRNEIQPMADAAVRAARR